MVTGACGTAEDEGHEPAAGTDKAEGGRPVPGEQDSTDRARLRWEAPEGGQCGGAARAPGGRDLSRRPSSQPAPSRGGCCSNAPPSTDGETHEVWKVRMTQVHSHRFKADRVTWAGR